MEHPPPPPTLRCSAYLYSELTGSGDKGLRICGVREGGEAELLLQGVIRSTRAIFLHKAEPPHPPTSLPPPTSSVASRASPLPPFLCIISLHVLLTTERYPESSPPTLSRISSTLALWDLFSS